MEYLLKSQKNRLRSLVESLEKSQVKRLNVQYKSFEYKIQKIYDVSKECHDLFVEQVTNIKEYVDQKKA